MIDEQVVIAALKVEMCREPFVFVKQLLAVGKVTPDAHIRASGKRKAEVAHGSEQIVESYALVQPAFTAFIAAISQDNLRTRGEVACQQPQPLVALRAAVGFGEDEPVVFAGFHAEGGGKLLPADVAGRVGDKTVVEVRVFLFQQGEVIFAFVRVSVINDDNLKLRIILLQHSFQVTPQVFAFFTCADDDRHRRELLREVYIAALHGTAAQVDAVVQAKVIKGLNDKKSSRRCE